MAVYYTRVLVYVQCCSDCNNGQSIPDKDNGKMVGGVGVVGGEMKRRVHVPLKDALRLKTNLSTGRH